MFERTPLPQLLTLTNLVGWLETKDPETTYSYTDCFDCLIARFVKDAGHQGAAVTPNIVEEFGEKTMFPNEIERVSIDFPRTYGGALRRARAALARQAPS